MIGKQGVSLLIGKQGVQVKTTLSASSEVLARGIYNPTTLSAVDADLAAGNIKDAVTIFGKLGTFVGGPLVEDVLQWDGGGIKSPTSGTYYRGSDGITAGSDLLVASVIPTFAAVSMATGIAITYGVSSSSNTLKTRLLLGGV